MQRFAIGKTLAGTPNRCYIRLCEERGFSQLALGDVGSGRLGPALIVPPRRASLARSSIITVASLLLNAPGLQPCRPGVFSLLDRRPSLVRHYERDVSLAARSVSASNPKMGPARYPEPRIASCLPPASTSAFPTSMA